MGTNRKPLAIITALVVLLLLVTSWYWSREPGYMSLSYAEKPIVGVATTEMLIKSVDTLLNKPGGFLTNDVAPPGVFLDNMPNWEFGVLQQVRDLAKAMRDDYSRSQTQSLADPDLERAEPLFNNDSEKWFFPSAEGKYRQGRDE